MILATLAAAATLNCWVSASQQYGEPAYLLYAMASVESSFDPLAVAHARDGSHSIGLMQVNSRWLPTLAGSGLSEQDLFEPCTNVHVGAWSLAQEIARYGYSWMAIGSYYAGPLDGHSRDWKLRDYRNYSEKVLSRWRSALDGKLIVGAAPAHKRAGRAASTRYVGAIGQMVVGKVDQ